MHLFIYEVDPQTNINKRARPPVRSPGPDPRARTPGGNQNKPLPKNLPIPC
jgi:hypothetical protein